MTRATVAVILLALALAPAATAQSGSMIQDRPAAVDPNARAPGVAATPETSATPLPVTTPTADQTPTPVPNDSEAYLTPGYGNAAQQSQRDKRREQTQTCAVAHRPPTSHMLSVPGTVEGDSGGSWVPVVVAVAIGAALFAAIAFVLRRGEGKSRPGPLEGIATLVAICGGLAGLAAQFVPSAAVKERPAPEATMAVRDVKPRITRREYLKRADLSRHGLKGADLDEIGNVVWLEIGLKGFKDHPLNLEYGLYDLDAHEALLPGSSRRLYLKTPRHDVQTSFVPVWVGYPRSMRFMAEFRLIGSQGVTQIAATGKMSGSLFRYDCKTQR